MRVLSVVFDLSLDTVESIALAQEDLEDSLGEEPVELVWIDPAQIHVALKVMRNIDGAMIERVSETVESVARALVPFKVGATGLTADPSPERPQLVCATIDSGLELVVGLQKVLDLHLERIGVPIDPRSFRALAVSGRLRVPERRVDLSEQFAAVGGLDFGQSYVKHISLLDGTLDRHGARWGVVRRYRLGGQRTKDRA